MLTENDKKEISDNIEKIIKKRLQFTECDVLKNDIEQFCFLLIDSFCSTNKSEITSAEPPLPRIPNYLTLKLLSREIKIIVLKESISNLEPRLTGKINYLPPEIFVENKNVFITVMHELIHFYLNFSGQAFTSEFQVETVCEIFPYFLQQLIIENGQDILIKILMLGKN